MSVSWLSVEMRTGKVIADLADVACEKIGATLCNYFAVPGASLPLSGAPIEWQRALMPYGSVLIALEDDQPKWGGIVTQAPRTQAAAVSFSMATWEAYFARRYVADLAYVGAEQCYIAADLVTSSLDSTVPLIVEYTPGTTTRTIAWDATADKTVLAALSELSALDGGPEWTIRWRHLSDPERYVPVLTIADRIGVAATIGPAATFEYPGCVSEFSHLEDWSEGSGANRVVATSTSSGGDRPQSDPQTYADPDRPTIEYRYSPGDGLEAPVLNDHARAAVSVLKDGSASLTLSAVVADAPRLGVEWGIGDDVGYRIDAPSGFREGVSRCLAWERTTTGVETITPILAAEG